ncbi:MAG: helix-turn-helix domain-containing protein [Agriterribacter sp.]|nr:MAG: transcriptional regulator [Sphingobacteriales bacterium 40-81]
MNKKIAPVKMPDKCTSHLRAIHDTLDMLNGKWKIAIIGSLSFGKKRFMELQREVTGIGSKMLSKELRDLEINELVKRTVYDTKPVTVEYELTDYGKTLQSIINEMAKWGTQHRKRIMNVIEKKEAYA